MAELRELQHKLNSVDSLREVVTAMRNLAAIYVRRAEAALEAVRPYSEIVETCLDIVLARLPRAVLEPRPDGLALAVVFASDQGLCGTYNERAAAAAANAGQERQGPVEYVAIGQRVAALLSMRGVEPALVLHAPTSLEGIRSRVPELAADIFDAYTERGATEMLFIYNAYEGMGRSQEHVIRVLPPRREVADDAGQDAYRYEPLLTAAPEELLGSLAEEYFFIQLYRALFESHSSENGARLLSMTSAANNIDNRYRDLTREFHTARQDFITAELLDVVGGAEALMQGQ